MSRGIAVAIAGATGAVGREMALVLEQRKFPVASIRLLASERSAGSKARFAGEEVAVETLTESSFSGIDLVLFSAGGTVSRKFAPVAAKAGAVVVDNSSAFRMQPGVPLVVPEVNPDALAGHQGIIANPNCSTILFLMAVQPIHRAARIGRAVVASYQAVSGSGQKGIDETRFPHRIEIDYVWYYERAKAECAGRRRAVAPAVSAAAPARTAKEPGSGTCV